MSSPINFTPATFYDTDAPGHPQPSDPYINSTYFNNREQILNSLVQRANQTPVGFTESTTKTANYTASANEIVVADTSGGTFTITGPSNGLPFGVRWKSGIIGPIIAAPTNYTVNGLATTSLNLAPSTSSGELVIWQVFSSSDYHVAFGFKPQSALDSRNDTVFVPGGLSGGSTSVRSQIQSIIDDASSRGIRTIKVSPSTSTYLLDGPIKLYSNMNWVAYGATFAFSGGVGKRFISNAACLSGNNSVRDMNIRVFGGTYSRGSLAGAGGTLDMMNIMFAFVDGLEIADVSVNSTDGKYAIYLYNCNRFHVHHCDFNVASDGVHSTGAASNGEINHITGVTHDDAVAIMHLWA